MWWWAVPLALLVGLGAVVALRRRSTADMEAGDEPAPATELSEAQTPPAPIVPTRPHPVPGASGFPPAAVPPAPAFPTPTPALGTDAIELSFQPLGMRLSLVYATLRYRISIKAISDLVGGQLLGDMIGAHASIPVEEQLAPALDLLPVLKAVPPVAAGESMTLTDEIQLPLSAIRPLKQAGASLFVPLARFCIVLDNGIPAIRTVYTLGIESGGAGLAPLRLDTGPQEHRALGARQIEAAHVYPLHPADPHRAAS